MEYISAREAAGKWGISQRRVAVLCGEGRIAQAAMVGNMWLIPAGADKPTDARKACPAPDGMKKVRPFLKWAGGKGQLLSEIQKYYPLHEKQITKYAEPFVGGGAILFDILSRFDLQAVYISDSNAELINTYLMIRDRIHELLALLRQMQAEYLPLEAERRKAYYSSKRSRFNELKQAQRSAANIEKAACFIFLNRTCFNGLYRVNKNGLFNVPMGAYKKPLICDEENLKNVSAALQKVQIVCGDYRDAREFIDEHTFVYFDPPYRPITATASFTAYTENAFDDTAQVALAAFVKELHQKGAKIVISNSDPKNADAEDNFFDELYGEHQIKRVKANRMINCDRAARGKITELLISNFD